MSKDDIGLGIRSLSTSIVLYFINGIGDFFFLLSVIFCGLSYS